MPIKQKGVVTFTIHDLKIPISTTDTFQIEFKRGSSSGSTEHVFASQTPDAQNYYEVIFGKEYHCPVTLYRDLESDTEYKKKKIAFTVYRFHSKTRKVFGKFQIDASKYVQPKTDTFEVESPHSQKSFASISVHLTVNKDKVDGIDDLSSMSEALQLTTERVEDWDLSDIVTPEKNEQIQSFFQRREKEKAAQRVSLSDFMSSPSKKRSHQHSRHVSTSILSTNSLFPPQFDSELYLKPKSSERIQKPKRTLTDTGSASMDEFEVTESSDKLNLEPGGSDEQILDKSDKIEKKKKKKKLKKKEEGESADNQNSKKKKDKQDEVLGHEDEILKIRFFLKSVLTKYWDDSPIDKSKMPKTAAVLTAALLHARIFRNDIFTITEYQTIINEFNENYIEGTCINQVTTIDKWILSLYYIASTLETKEKYSNDENLSQQRFDMFVNALNGICELQLDDIAIAHIKNFYTAIADKIIGGQVDGTKALELLKIQIEQSQLLIDNAPAQIIDFFEKYIVHLLDILLVQTILNNPDRCTFQSAGEWNSIITILSEDSRFSNLPKFRQAAQLFLMPSMLCDDPSYQSEMCPDLDPSIVCRLLKSQKVDEFWPIQNDTAHFEEHFNLTANDLGSDLPFEFVGTFFDLAKTLKCEDWHTYTFDEDTKMLFPFLAEYFS